MPSRRGLPGHCDVSEGNELRTRNGVCLRGSPWARSSLAAPGTQQHREEGAAGRKEQPASGERRHQGMTARGLLFRCHTSSEEQAQKQIYQSTGSTEINPTYFHVEKREYEISGMPVKWTN